jgi:hypothetical protein
MLNSIKKIQHTNNYKKSPFFFKAPFPLKGRFQMQLKPDLTFLEGLPVVLAPRIIKKKKW